MRNTENEGYRSICKRRSCPLYLLSSDKAEVASAVEAMLPVGTTPDCCQELADVLYQNKLLLRLRRVQEEWNQVGFSDACIGEQEGRAAIDDGEATAVAMTVRDCTLFIKIQHEGATKRPDIEMRLGDLDPKPATPANIDKWRAIENRLIGQGWYEAKVGAQSGHRCALAR